jgi:hypothetical protein
MKKVILAVSLMLATSASATDLTVMTGRDKVFNKDLVQYSVSQPFLGFKVTGSLQDVRDTYRAVGVSVGKPFDLGRGFSLTPAIGVQQFNPQTGKNGWASTAGVGAAYALNTNAAIVADVTRRFDMSDATAFRGNQASVGLKVSF